MTPFTVTASVAGEHDLGELADRVYEHDDSLLVSQREGVTHITGTRHADTVDAAMLSLRRDADALGLDVTVWAMG